MAQWRFQSQPLNLKARLNSISVTIEVGVKDKDLPYSLMASLSEFWVQWETLCQKTQGEVQWNKGI